jgi:hypothetical protein
MSNEIEVIKIKHIDGYAIINKEDFDKSKHELFKKEEKKESKKISKKKIKKEEK